MADNVKWIKIVTNIFDDEKMKLIDAMPDNDAILVVWFKLLVQAGKSNHLGALCLNENIPYTEEMLATVFNRKIQVVRLALQTFENLGMIERSDIIQIANWEKHQNIDGMDKIRIQNQVRKQRQRDREKTVQIPENAMSRDGHVTVTQCHATDIELDIDKDIDKESTNKKSVSTNTSHTRKAEPTLEEVNHFFKEIDAVTDGTKFFFHYQSNGWKIKGSPIEDWKAKAKLWNLGDIAKLSVTDKPKYEYAKSKLPDVEIPWLEDYIANLK